MVGREPRAAKPLVVLVEDNRILAKTYEQIFGSTKELRCFRLASFETAWEAMEFMNLLPDGEPPAAIILDWMLEGMSGMDLLVEVRKDSNLASVPVLMATAKTERREVAEALSKGANDYLVKPLNTRVLVQKLGRLTGACQESVEG